MVQFALAGLLLLESSALNAAGLPRHDGLSLRQVEERLAVAQAEQSRLARLMYRSGVGNLGWESKSHKSADATEWVKIEFDEEHLIDQVVLVPILWRDEFGVVYADGFPAQFKVFVGKQDDDIGEEVASFDESNDLLPRVEPLVIPIKPTVGAWIRVKASKLSQRGFDKKFRFQLSEIMVFQGDADVALGESVTVSSQAWNRVSKSTSAEALVDGFLPYLMSGVKGGGSQAFVCFFRTGPEASLLFDLGQQRQIDRIHLHASDLSETVPQIQHSDYALPDHLIVEGANQIDFSDAKVLSTYMKHHIYESGPIVMRRFEPYQCRFVRFRVIEGYKAPEARDSHRCIGFAEIEIFDHGQNVAIGIIPKLDFGVEPERLRLDGKIEALTDGRNHFGTILSVRDWISQLARRRELGLELSQIQRQLQNRYASHARYLRWVIAFSGMLLFAIAGIIVFNRLTRFRETNRLQERFAADLHDMVGADLHAIGLLSDMSRDHSRTTEEHDSILQEIRTVCSEASASVRQIVGVRTQSPYSDLVDLMNQSAERILVDIDHELTVEGNEFVEKLRPQTRAHLFLFFKECVVNVSRHSEATQLRTTLKASPKEVSLSVIDNGKGLQGTTTHRIPPSLHRRAKILGARVMAEPVDPHGTRVHLKFRRMQWNQFKKR